MNNRFIPFNKVYNFRDIGGLPTKDGRITKRGMIYRSESLDNYTKADLETIKTIGIKTIIDLRTPWEKSKNDYHTFDKESVNRVNIPIYPMPDKKDLDMKKHMTEMLKKKDSEPNFEVFMRENYQRMAFSHCEEIKTIFQILSERSNLPAIIHCTAGKDRTGWISYLLQSICDVEEDSISEDYLMSNRFLLSNQHLKRQRLKIALLSFGRYSLETFKPILEARLDYLNSVSGEIKKRYSTAEKYLSDCCTISTDTIAKIRLLFI
jgi:protein-tyrosine phosphatase